MLNRKHFYGLTAFSCFPTLFLYTSNFGSVSAIQTVIPLIISFSICALITIILSLVSIRRPIEGDKSFLIILWFSALFLFYGHVHVTLYNSDLAYIKFGQLTFNLGRNRYLLLISFLLSAAYLYLIINSKKLNRLSRIVNIFITALILQQLAIFLYKASIFLVKNRNNITQEIAKKTTDEYPDIYYIILDSYASSQTLRISFDYQNNSLETFLSKARFKNIANSYSNYPFTKFSLTSSLNFEYLDSPIYKYDENIFHYLKHNKISNLLKSKGYTYIYFDTGYGYKLPQENEVVIKDSTIQGNTSDNDFLGLFIKTTAFSLFIDKLSKITNEDYRKRINYAFEKLPEVANLENSKFVFLHLISPHPPYLFKEDGTSQRYVAENSEYAKTAYLQQLKYINKKVEIAVSAILKNSRKDPIIIIQSDHGVSFDNKFEITNEISLNDRYSILNSIYAPKNITDKFYKGISPVNTFRIISNELFESKNHILADKSYFTGQTPPYHYVDITKYLVK